MSILATLKKESAGKWPTLADYLREARHRETGALSALSAALTATPEEQKELAEAEDAGAILLDLASDLRVPKGSRLAAARCLLEAGISGALIEQLFIGAGDLVTDPRLGASARKLVEGGLPAGLQIGGEVALVTLAAGAFARAAQASAFAVGQARAKELLAAAPEGHAGAVAALFALGQDELPQGQRDQWSKLLADTCAKNRRAPAAAKRMGMAPPWPPNLPDAFAPLVQEAEKKNEGVVSADAATSPALLRRSSPLPTGPSPARPVQRGFRKPTGTVIEVPTAMLPKPMAEVKGRALRPEPAPQRPHIESREDAPLLMKPLPLPIGALPGRQKEQVKLDPKGRPIPRPDRWVDNHFEWEAPVLPSSDLPRPMRAAVAEGRFTQRVQSILEDRPEAVDRLCAAAEARAALSGEEELLRELSLELSKKRWQEKRAPQGQLTRLRAIEADAAHPGPWRSVARFLIDRLAFK